MNTQQSHVTVLLNEAVSALNIRSNGKYVDATYGRGGHSQRILAQLDAEGQLLAIDKDPQAIEHGQQVAQQDARFTIEHGSFASLEKIILQHGWHGEVDGILIDLGVSSPQLDDAKRGFSFQTDGPLDMRMDTSSGISAAQWIATAKEEDIANVLYEYGEERFSRRIARAIITARQQQPIHTTKQLSAIVAAANPKWEKHKDPATRSFQAIRIYINNELDDLKECLKQAVSVLKSGGRLVVISFHSLEDRIVKSFIREMEKGNDLPLDLPVAHVDVISILRHIGKAVKPANMEIENNPRARSAIMRIAEKV